MNIPIYAPACDDFTTNGLGMLAPLECVVEEQAAGMYELTLTLPIDDSLRWAQLAPGCILKVPAPVRESPLYEAPAMQEPVTVTRQVWQVHGTTHGLYLRSGPGMNYKRLGVRHNGDEIIELEDAPDPWKKVCVADGGAVGYMSTKYLRPLRTETEIINPGRPAPGTLKIGQSREQLFRIYAVEQDSAAATVTARALHVFYDEAGNLSGACEFTRPRDVNSALAEIKAGLALEPQVNILPLNLAGDVCGDFSHRSPVEILLDPDGGIIRQTNALLVRDNWDAWLLPDIARDRGVTIRRGKNLRGVEVVSDASGVATRIIPVGKNRNGDPLYLPAPGWVESPRAGEHPFPRIRRVEFDVQTGENGFDSDDAARAELKRLAEAQFRESGADLPCYGMDVDFVLLGNTAEYADYASLQAVHLYDTVTVIDELLGLKAKVRVTGYRWNCLTGQYEGVTLGEMQDVRQRVYSYSLPDGGVSGTKIMDNTLGGSALRNASIEYAKIAAATVGQLSANAITALTARVQDIVARKLTTDELYSAYAEMIALKAGTITAESIQTDALAAELARITVLAAGTAAFDAATIRHLVASAMNLEYGAAGQVFIKNLAVEYAQMVGAAIGELCIKASDGNYYLMDVNPDGTVRATPAAVSGSEAAAGQTSGGRVILETNITAASLNAGNLLATYALVNRIDAARIDVDALFAREAFVNLLRTGKIINGKSIEMIAGEVEDQSRRSGVELIPGAFAQADRRAGEGIHVLSEFGPRQEGSGDPSPENIRPITGRNALTLVHAGRNLLDMERVCDIANWINGPTWESYEIADAPGTYHFSCRPVVSRIDNFILNLSRSVDGSSSDAVTIVYVDVSRTECTFELKEGERLYFNCFFGYGFTQANLDAVVQGVLTQAQLEFGSAAAPYEPCRRKSCTAEFGETVYGGRLDWHAGRLVSQWGFIESYAGEALPGEWRSDRDVYARGTSPAIGAQVAYRLASPVEIHLSPARPTALEGINTVYTDADGGYVEFGHPAEEVIDSILPPLSPDAGAIWLDRSVTPAVLRRFSGSEWETLNDTTEIINAQNTILLQQQALRDKQAETDLYLKLDAANKAVHIGQKGVTSQYIIDAFGSGVSVNDEIFSRFEANRVLFGDMEMRKPSGVGGLAFDSIVQGGA